MTVDMSMSLELAETFSLSPLERAVNLNPWQNVIFVLDRAFLHSGAKGVFLTMVP